MMRSCRNLVLAVICILIVLTASVFSYDYPVEAPPPWLKVGTYVEYDCIALTEEGEGHFVFRWECIALSGINATLNITVTGHPAGNISVIVNIVTNTRELLSSNGTVLGKAGLWLPPNLKKGDRIVVSGKPPSERIAEVIDSGGSSTLTCQGYQELCQIAEVTGTKMNITHFDVGGFYDVDTGLHIRYAYVGFIVPSGVFIVPSGVLEYGEECNGIEFLRATNVDLGPRYLRTEILTFLWVNLPIIVPSIVFISVLVIMVRKRRKRKNLKQTKIS
jgi:hypothetical protein